MRLSARLMGVPLAGALLGALLPAFSMPRPADAQELAGTGALEFVAIGDLPYNEAQRVRLDGPIRTAILAANPPFLLHLGDIKGSKETCDDVTMQEARRRIMALHSGPVFYTPGDNDWTDCDRGSNAVPMSALERLRRLRQLFFAEPPAVPDAWNLAVQDGYPENRQWRLRRVEFATVHIVGTNNGRLQIRLDDHDDALAEVRGREAAAAAWIAAAFARAEGKADGDGGRAADALVLAFHADITKGRYKPGCSEGRPQDCDAFEDLRPMLKARAAAFGRPVLLIHGDTGDICLERFGGEEAPNLWRLNSAGDYAVIDAVRVSLAPHNKDRPFAAETLVGGEALPGSC